MSTAAKSLVSPLDIRSQITQLRKGNPLLADILGKVQDALNLKDKQFRNLADATLGLLPAMSLDGSHLKRLSVDGASIKSLDAGVITSGYIAAARFAAAVITTTMLNIKQIIVPDLILHDNSPGAGRVAWDACSVYWNGAAYLISAGSTASSSDKQIYWVIGAGAFTAAPGFTPMADRFAIATSDNGTSDVAWNKLAMNVVQEDHLSFGLITGIQVQQIVSLNIDLTTNAVTNVLNVTGVKGALLIVGVGTTVALFGGAGVTFGLQYTVDGLTPVDLPIIATATFDPSAKVLATNESGSGQSAGDRINFVLGLGFSNSLKIDAVVSGASLTNGTATVYLLYASKAN